MSAAQNRKKRKRAKLREKLLNWLADRHGEDVIAALDLWMPPDEVKS